MKNNKNNRHEYSNINRVVRPDEMEKVIVKLYGIKNSLPIERQKQCKDIKRKYAYEKALLWIETQALKEINFKKIEIFFN